MSLNFNYEGMQKHMSKAEWKHLTTHPEDLDKKDQRWHPVGEALVWLSMLIGFSSITEKNYQMIAKRISAYERALGTYLKGTEDIKDKPTNITAADVKLYIGLGTNASTKTDAQFEKWLGSTLMREARITEESSVVALIEDLYAEAN